MLLANKYDGQLNILNAPTGAVDSNATSAKQLKNHTPMYYSIL